MFGLSFLNAGILFATLATIIPLLIHLFIKNKPIKVYFSSLKFLREVIEEQRKKMTINQIILLILRMLTILFIVLSLAKPVIKLPFVERSNYHPPTAVAFILDTSPSMDYVIEQKTQIQYGIDIIKNIQKNMTKDDISLIYTSDFLYNSLKSRLIYGTPPENELSNISFTWNPEPLSRLIDLAEKELETSQYLHKEIYIISDFNYENLGFSAEDLNLPTSFITTFSDTLRINLSTEKVVIKRELIDGNLQRIAEFEVMNNSPLNLRDQIVRLNLNGTTIAEKMIDFQPFEKKIDYFVINHENLNWNSGYVEIRNERFLPDNKNFFTFYSDPRPKIGVITDQSSIPKHISVLANLFIGKNGHLEFINHENLQLSDIDKYHFFIFYLNHYSNRIQALISDLKKNNCQSLFILNSALDDTSKRFFTTNYGLEISETNKNTILEPITSFHQWHRIVGDFKFNTSLTLYSKPALNINVTKNNIPLVSTNSNPLVIENKDIFINIDFSANQNFFTYPAFPIIIYRSLSWISRYDGRVNDHFVGDDFVRKAGVLKNPNGEEFDTMLSGLRFNQPGIWIFKDKNNKTEIAIAVNMSDYQNQSRHQKPNINTLHENYLNFVLSTDKGNELWKLLLWACLLFLAFEMGFVLFLSRNK